MFKKKEQIKIKMKSFTNIKFLIKLRIEKLIIQTI